MSITAEFPYQCPVCKEGHARAYSAPLAGLAVIACPKVSPTGMTLTFPKFAVIVVGAGIGVDQDAPKEPTLDELRAQVAQAKAAKAAPAIDVDAERAKLKAELDKLQGGAK